MMSIFFIAQYTLENLELTKLLLDSNSLSKAVLWTDEQFMDDSLDYNGSFNRDYEVLNRIHLIKSAPYQNDFLNIIYGFLMNNQDLMSSIIIRGDTTQIWQLALIKAKDHFIDSQFIAIVDKIYGDLEEFEIQSLLFFDKIIGMGPSILKIKAYNPNIIILFNEFESSEFIYHRKFDIDLNNRELFLCNSNNFANIVAEYGKEKLGNRSFIDIDRCLSPELFKYMILCEKIINCSEKQEIEKLAKKINKKILSIKEFIDGVKEYKLEDDEKNLKEFAMGLKEDIMKNINVDFLTISGQKIS